MDRYAKRKLTWGVIVILISIGLFAYAWPYKTIWIMFATMVFLVGFGLIANFLQTFIKKFFGT